MELNREKKQKRERDVEGGRKLVYKEATWGKKRGIYIYFLTRIYI